MTAGGREWGREEGPKERGSRFSRSQTPSHSFPRAPEPLAARSARRRTGAQREPVQGRRGAAAAAVHAACSGLPGAGKHAGARRGGRRPIRDADRQVSRAARAARPLLPLRPARAAPTRPGSCPPLGPALDLGTRWRGRRGAVGVSGAPGGCAHTGLGEPARAMSVPTAVPPLLPFASLPFPSFPSLGICSVPAPALTPPPSNSETLGTANLEPFRSRGPALPGPGPRGTGECTPSPCAPTAASPPFCVGAGERVSLGRRASSPSLRPRPRRFLESLKSLCVSELSRCSPAPLGA